MTSSSRSETVSNCETSSKPAQPMASHSDCSTTTADGSAINVTRQASAAELRLQRSELLAFGAILPHEAGGLLLGSYSPTRQLNLRTGRNWSAWQWQEVLRSDYERMTGPTSLTTGVTSPQQGVDTPSDEP
jgi:hypothetical protein